MGLLDNVNVNVGGNGRIIDTLSTYVTKVLKPNIVDGRNILIPAMISSKNTKYVIKYDFELEENITVPENCVLEFDGGSISGAYTLTGTNTSINAGLVKILSTDIILAGTWNVSEAYPEWFGAKGDGITNDTESLQKCLSSFRRLSAYRNYHIGYLTVPSYAIIDGLGRGILVNTTDNSDILLMLGSNTEGGETHDVVIRNITLKGGRFCIQGYGPDNTYKPYNIKISNVVTKESVSGGIFINSCHDCEIDSVKNYGGRRAIGIQATIASPLAAYNISIRNCSSYHTTGYCYQTYYGKNIKIENCFANGSLLALEDKTCITIDRTTEVLVSGNTCENSAKDGIFVTGSKHVTVVNNIVLNSNAIGIQVCYNLEQDEDPNIHESKDISVQNNLIKESVSQDILLNGVKRCCVQNNICINSNATKGIFVMDTNDINSAGYDTISEDISLISNICNKIEKNGSFNGNGKGLILLGNIYQTYLGFSQAKDVIADYKTACFSSDNVYLKILRREIPVDSAAQLLRVYTSPTGSYSKGFTEKYNYGILQLTNENGTDAFSFGIGQGGNVGDFTVAGAGKGVILKSPDGTKRKRLSIDNSGNIALSDL